MSQKIRIEDRKQIKKTKKQTNKKKTQEMQWGEKQGRFHYRQRSGKRGTGA